MAIFFLLRLIGLLLYHYCCIILEIIILKKGRCLGSVSIFSFFLLPPVIICGIDTFVTRFQASERRCEQPFSNSLFFCTVSLFLRCSTTNCTVESALPFVFSSLDKHLLFYRHGEPANLYLNESLLKELFLNYSHLGTLKTQLFRTSRNAGVFKGR